jgi:hypothetical protein
MQMATKKKITPPRPSGQKHELYSEGPSVLAEFGFWIVGDMPLIVHAWSTKAKEEMLSKQLKTAKVGREARDPDQDFLNSLYPMGEENGVPVYGFPATGLKNAILSVAHKDKGIAKTDVMSSLFIHGKMSRGVAAKAGAICDLPLIRLWAPPPSMREDMVKIGVGLNKTASLAYRGQFFPWAMRVTGNLNTVAISSENLAFLVREAGMACGLGEWRNERRGMFGSYHLASKAEAALWQAHAHGGPMPPVLDTPLTIAAE